jgi:hypothetical protein
VTTAYLDGALVSQLLLGVQPGEAAWSLRGAMAKRKQREETEKRLSKERGRADAQLEGDTGATSMENCMGEVINPCT